MQPEDPESALPLLAVHSFRFRARRCSTTRNRSHQPQPRAPVLHVRRGHPGGGRQPHRWPRRRRL